MCGIFGYYNFNEKEFKSNLSPLNTLMNESYSRGKEASGIVCSDETSNVHLIKSDLDGRSLLKTKEYKNFTADVNNRKVWIAMGHSRLATHGSQLISDNNQPVSAKNNDLIAVHNGIITNPEILWKTAKKEGPMPILDTQALLDYYAFLLESYDAPSATKLLYENIEGSASLAIINPSAKTLNLSTNTGSLYYLNDTRNKSLYFASEILFLYEILKELGANKSEIKHLKPGSALSISPEGMQAYSFLDVALKEGSTTQFKQTNLNNFSATTSKSEATKLYGIKNSLEQLKKHDFDYDRIYSIPRCTKCILPASTPFITFDKLGVCNFCNEHQPITQLGMDELKKIVSKYKKGNGEPDCLAAFSGGRDSSYGLHFLKKELGLQPLAYTYDWGMVTDVARKNQAKILGKLGIEHLVLSADITKKRKHIRENILAWMKDPHLGMVPLFMEGDKQCEYYADQKMKNYGLDLMFFFRGNELEKDEFKTGHCGVKDADPGGVIHHLELQKKIKLLSFYASRYFKNPAYFNSSFVDTSLGFFSTYIQKHDYLYLWHYVPWDEKTIMDTLQNEYNWEISSETNQTWRTDDGTSAFYNYIYYQGQGFTENDSFRSRQIREGLLDRDTALKLVNGENKPRYKALQWYFDMVGLDGDKVLTVVDNMKKCY